jgi:hypothetical protein
MLLFVAKYVPVQQDMYIKLQRHFRYGICATIAFMPRNIGDMKTHFLRFSDAFSAFSADYL